MCSNAIAARHLFTSCGISVTMPAMQITFELTEQDFVNAYKTHCSRGPSSKWRGAIWVCFLVIFLGVIFHSIATNMSDLSRYVPLAILAIAWFVLIRWLQL